MDILEKIDKIEQELSVKTEKLKETLSAAEKAAEKDIKKIRAACEHDYSDWGPIYFNNGTCGVKRGCPVCGDSEIMSFERYLKESQENIAQKDKGPYHVYGSTWYGTLEQMRAQALFIEKSGEIETGQTRLAKLTFIE